jgi:multidrug efflux pump subunit AcrB
MTALAMIIAMLPMALGPWRRRGEQNSLLGRAVIGGLLVATPTTLLFVRIVYSLLRRKAPVRAAGKSGAISAQAASVRFVE